jgi:hypothetical protein
MGEEFLGTKNVYRGTDPLPDGARLDLRKLRRLQVADLLIGNTDRHYKNIWFAENPRTKLFEPIAFDHNFSLGDRVLSPSWKGGATFERAMADSRGPRGAVLSATTRTALYRNPISAGALQHPERVGEYFTEARSLQEALPDHTLKKMVDDIPDEAFGKRDPVLRRK